MRSRSANKQSWREAKAALVATTRVAVGPGVKIEPRRSGRKFAMCIVEFDPFFERRVCCNLISVYTAIRQKGLQALTAFSRGFDEPDLQRRISKYAGEFDSDTYICVFKKGLCLAKMIW